MLCAVPIIWSDIAGFEKKNIAWPDRLEVTNSMHYTNRLTKAERWLPDWLRRYTVAGCKGSDY